MKKIIVVLMFVFIAYSQVTYGGYNVHQKVEAEKEYERITKMIENIEKALSDIDVIEKDKKGDLSFSGGDVVTWGIDYGNAYVTATTVDVKHINVAICGEVADLMRDEFKVLLQKHLAILKEQRERIEVR